MECFVGLHYNGIKTKKNKTRNTLLVLLPRTRSSHSGAASPPSRSAAPMSRAAADFLSLSPFRNFRLPEFAVQLRFIPPTTWKFLFLINKYIHSTCDAHMTGFRCLRTISPLLWKYQRNAVGRYPLLTQRTLLLVNRSTMTRSMLDVANERIVWVDLEVFILSTLYLSPLHICLIVIKLEVR